jgi:hypothetical protein
VHADSRALARGTFVDLRRRLRCHDTRRAGFDGDFERDRVAVDESAAEAARDDPRRVTRDARAEQAQWTGTTCAMYLATRRGPSDDDGCTLAPYLMIAESPGLAAGPAWQWPETHVRVPSHSQSFAQTPLPPPFHASFQR